MNRISDLEKKYVMQALEDEFQTSKNSNFNNKLDYNKKYEDVRIIESNIVDNYKSNLVLLYYASNIKVS